MPFFKVEQSSMEAAINMLAQMPYGRVASVIEAIQKSSSGPFHDLVPIQKPPSVESDDKEKEK